MTPDALCYDFYSLSGLFLLSRYLLSLILFLIFHVPELFLFLLSSEDNHYVDKTLVYKVVSYS